jgi:hypothetical protein
MVKLTNLNGPCSYVIISVIYDYKPNHGCIYIYIYIHIFWCSVTYLGSWALINPIITSKFLLDSYLFLLGVIGVTN